MAGVNVVGLVKDPLLLAFIIHLEDMLLPLGVGPRDPEADVGDHIAIVRWDPSSYSSDEGTALGLIRELVGKFGLPL